MTQYWGPIYCIIALAPMCPPPQESSEEESADLMRISWRQGTPAPERMDGAAVVHGNMAYFSQGHFVYSYSNTLPADKWTRLTPCEYECFSLAVVGTKLTTIGGQRVLSATNSLLCLSCVGSEMKWEKVLPPMPTKQKWPSSVVTPTHLVVAGGRTKLMGGALSTVEILNLNTLQWSSASSSPKALKYPNMTLCGGYLYLSEDSTIFSCSVEELLKSCEAASTDRDDTSPLWTRLTDIPVPYNASLASLRRHVLAIGGSEMSHNGDPIGAIHSYDTHTNTWSVIGEMPTPRYLTLVAVLPRDKLIVVGGQRRNQEADYNIISWSNITEIGYPH